MKTLKTILLLAGLFLTINLTIPQVIGADITACGDQTQGTLLGCENDIISKPDDFDRGSTAYQDRQNKLGVILGKYIPLVVNTLAGLVAIAAVFMIIYAGYQYLTNLGNEKEITAANDTMVYGVIGLFIAFGAYFVMYVINNLL